MIPGLSATARFALDSMNGLHDGGGEVRVSGLPQSAGPTVVKLKDPLADVEALVEKLDDNTGRRPPNTWLARNRSGSLSSDRSRVPVIEGRRCCFQTIEGINRRMHLLPVPSPIFKCSCGAEYRVEMRIREERKHL